VSDPITATTEPELLGRVYDEVLRPSFPDSELVTRAEFIAAGCSGVYDVLVADGPLGLRGAIVGERHGGAVLVTWLAVAAAGRGGGTGGALIVAGRRRWLARPGVRLLLAEVERPDLHPAHPQYGDPARRLAFYQRHGAGVLDLPYFQPAVAEGMPRVHGLLLTVLPGPDDPGVPRTLSAVETTAVREYLDAVLGAPTPGDEDLHVVHAAAHRTGGIRLLPLGDYAQVAVTGGLSPRS